MDIHISAASDDNYCQHLGVLLTSILYNNRPEDKLHIYVLTSGLSKKNKSLLEKLKDIQDFNLNFLEIDPSIYSSFCITRHTVATYFRLRMPEILKNIDKIIYLDVDIIVRDSLRPFWEIDLEDKIIGACHDSIIWLATEEQKNEWLNWNHENYVNAGVLLMNQAKMREVNFEKQILDWLKQHQDLTFPDQDAINALFSNDIMILPPKWNYQLPMFYHPTIEENPSIIHYTTMKKPWNFNSDSPYRYEYWKYKKISPWKHTLPRKISLINILRYIKNKF